MGEGLEGKRATEECEMRDGEVMFEVMGEQGSHSSFSSFPSVPCSPSLWPLPHRSLIFQSFFSPSPFRSPLSFSPSPQVASSLFPLPCARCPVPSVLCPVCCALYGMGEKATKREKGGEGKRELEEWDMRDGIFEGMGEKGARRCERREARGERRDVKG